MTYILIILVALSIVPGASFAQNSLTQPAQAVVSIQEKPMTNLTEAQARAAIAPWYGLFNVASRGDVKAIQEQILTEDSESCAGYLPGECWAARPRSRWFRILPTASPT
jgi:hypothetical protein